jgi:lipoate-protein ligase A
MSEPLPTPESIQPLRHGDIPPESNPTGEQLLDRAQRPYRVWVPQGKAIVLGNSQEAEKELNLEAVLRDGVAVHKRMSGGGAVLLSPGCLCLGLRFAKRKELSIADYFAKASALISGVVSRELGLELRLRGTSDLACTVTARPAKPMNDLVNGLAEAANLVNGLAEAANDAAGISERKVAGCALYMPRDYVLYLVSILVDPDFADIEKYLAHPSKEPEYRSGRSHGDFLGGLAALSGKAVTAAEMVPWFEKKIPAEPGLDLDWELAAGG